jgi:Phosphoglucose isomerase
MGVELGKVLAKNILAQLGNSADVQGHDSSVSDLNSQEVTRFLKRSALPTDDRPHPLLSEVQEGMIDYRNRVCVRKCKTRERLDSRRNL